MATEGQSKQPATATPSKKTMFNYFTKLPSKTKIIEENPRKEAPTFNKQHVEQFQARVDVFDAELLSDSPHETNYLQALKAGNSKPFHIDRKPRGLLRARLMQFCEDVRPPYFGTWQKKSKQISGRRPFHQDTEVFNYEVDSEAEWDIGGPGESLKGDDSEDDEDGLDDYEIDMKTFVPHGYVSDDEINSDDDSSVKRNAQGNLDKPGDKEKGCDAETVDSDSDIRVIFDSNKKEQQQIDASKQTPKMDIKPIILGLSFEGNQTVSESKAQFLRAFQGVSCT